MSGILKSTMAQFVRGQMEVMDNAARETAESGMKTARIFAPKDTYALVGSGQVTKNGIAHYTIKFGDGKVPYARRREFENNLHPGAKHYLQRGGYREVSKLPQAVERNARRTQK